MEEEQIDPADLERIPDIIRKSKLEVGKTDILICGNCHLPFYQIEAFQHHRNDNKCAQESILRDNDKVEPKEQIWAFTLWKNGLLSSLQKGEPLTTWTLYKRWCALNEKDKEAWVIAGQNLQTFTKLSLSRMQEIKGRTQSTVKKTKINSVLTPERMNVVPQFPQNSDTLEEGEVRLSQLTDAQRAAIKAQIAANKTNKENTTGEIKKVPTKLAQLYSDLIKKPPELRRALRTGKNNSIEEAVFEKVLSRRFNHKNKVLEYFVKWENMKESENTWEPKAHFEKCKQIMDEFDKVFNTSKIVARPLVNQSMDSQLDSETEQIHARPARTSKQKARDQVKSWCDNMSDDDGASGKRKLYDDDSDSSDSFEKKIKMEEESDSSEEDRHIRRTKMPSGSVNGIGKKSNDNITPQRIVRVSQKHLPNLSTGVYIMSKTEGIIKLNSDTPVPSSSPLLKVGQKIGQTHVKMVKKDMTRSPVKILPKPVKTSFDIPVSAPHMPVKVPPAPVLEPPDVFDNKPFVEDDSDDGLSEWEFPADLPLPEPDSPPGDFVLDPLTGKIAGQEYIEKEEPLKDDDEPTHELDSDVTSLDTLVKLAVSELPDVDDIVNDDKLSTLAKIEDITSNIVTPALETPSLLLLDSSVHIKTEPVPVVVKSDIHAIPSTSKTIVSTTIDLESAITLSAIEKTPPPLKPKLKSESGASILNAALMNAKVPQKKLLSTTPNTIRQKVTPRPEMRMPSPSTTIIHKVPNRPKPFPHRAPLQDPIVRRTQNVATYKPASNVARRIGSTTIYKTGAKSQQQQQPSTPKAKSSFRHQAANSRELARISTVSSAAPISMPLIGIDDEPESIPSTSAAIVDSTDEDLLPNLSNDLPTINLADTETPLFITGEDGTIYQVAGQNEDGQTILISEGPDGQQQCVIVSTEATGDDETSQPILMEAPSEMQEEPAQLDENIKMDIEEPDGENDGSDDSQVVAQIVKADPPSPGGTRKVVLMLPDGNLMMTDVTAEQYAALELDK